MRAPAAISILFGALLAPFSLRPAPAQGEAQRLLAEANAHYRALRPAEAIRLYRLYLEKYADNAEVRAFLGAAYLNLSQTQEALAEAQHALQLDPGCFRAHTVIGRAQAALGRWGQAEKAFLAALRINPTDRDALYFLGRSYYEQNVFEKARDTLLKAIDAKAEFSRTYEMLGLTWEAMLENELAEKAYRRATELAAGEYRPYFAYGLFLLKQDRTAESLAMLEKAVALDPRAAEAHFELGKLLLRLDRLEDAARETEKAVELSGECRYRPQLIRIYGRLGQTAAAEAESGRLRACSDVK